MPVHAGEGGRIPLFANGGTLSFLIGVTPSFPMGVSHPSQWEGVHWDTSHQGWMGVPSIKTGWGYLLVRSGWGYPSQDWIRVHHGQDWMEVPPIRTGWGYPSIETGWGGTPSPIRRQSSIASTSYEAAVCLLRSRRRTFMFQRLLCIKDV